MTKTLTNLLNRIIKGKFHHNFKEKTYPAITTQQGFILSDEFIYLEMFTDNVSGDLIVDNSKDNIRKLQTATNLVNGYIKNCKLEIELPSIKYLKDWIKSDFVYNTYNQPYLIEFDNKFNGKRDYIGFNASYLVDFITITKAKKVYICKNEKGIETAISPIYYTDENINALLMPMRIRQEYVEMFKQSLKDIEK